MIIVSYYPGEGTRNPPLGQGYEGRGHRPPTLDYHLAKFTLHIRWRITVHFADIVQATLPETINLEPFLFHF